MSRGKMKSQRKIVRELLFKVIAEGREYRIYTNGEIEGFGPDARVFNYYPQRVSKSNALWSPTKRAAPAGSGG